MCKITTMIVISFFEGSLCGTYVYLFNIPTNVNIIRSMTMYLHLINYKLKLTLSLKGAIIFICTIVFRGLCILIINITEYLMKLFVYIN